MKKSRCKIQGSYSNSKNTRNTCTLCRRYPLFYISPISIIGTYSSHKPCSTRYGGKSPYKQGICHKSSYYPNSGVEKYRSAVSGRTVTTVFPFPSFWASFRAAATLVPLEMPHIRPSIRARFRAVSMASSSVTI